MLHKYSLLISLIIISVSMSACSKNKTKSVVVAPSKPVIKKQITTIVYEKRSPKKIKQRRPSGSFANKLSSAALGRLRSRIRYDGSYVKIAYPWGDVPQNIGVCTDVVIRSYRKLGIDLQQLVHKDMSQAFASYPNPRKWGLSRPDTNIDHRRVYNLRQFFARQGAALPITRNPRDYRPGDLVTWMVGPDLPHIGVVVNRRSKVDPSRHMIVHNIARGPEMEDILFRFPITGHYRYTQTHVNRSSNRSYIASSRKRNNSLNYSELVEAARILGNIPSRPAKPMVVSKQSKTSVQIANLSDFELQKLLGNNSSLK